MPVSKTPSVEQGAKANAEMKIYCTYCGKPFTRKEHLERHLPSHTNVKPHRCGACQLSFARRDLLQRHYTTYHEARDHMDPLPGGMPTVVGRTPIACQNCANAKTGCDKKVPCARCAEKNLPCEARFARRSSKAAIRAAQASAAFQGAHTQSPQQAHNLGFSQGGVKVETNGSPTAIEVALPGDRDEAGSPMIRTSPHQPQIHLGDFPSPRTRVEPGLDEYMHMANDFNVQDPAYQDILMWPDFQMDLDGYPGSMQFAGTDNMSMAIMPDLNTLSPTSELVTPTASSSRNSIHTPGTSTMSSEYDNLPKPLEFVMGGPTENSIPEFEVVMVAEGAWNLARCNPPTITGNCPRTALVHLECLEQKSKQDGTWRSLEKYLEQVDWGATDLTSVVPLTSRMREKMLAITQSFLHKALEIHRGGFNGYPRSGYSSPGDFNFIVLPPSKILEYFLRSYVRSLSVYYPLVTGGCVDPNEMLQNNQASTLLVLLMIAQGAAAMPMAEARYLSAGLTETCRISLFDIVEKDVELSADPIALRCALLFIVLGAWSGDKWLMDIAMGQRGMYMSMLKHAGMLEPQPPIMPEFNDSTTTEIQWRSWVQRETQNRLVYNYVMLDQELSLFHDTAPLFAINELQCPLPGPEELWMSTSSEQWFTTMQSLHNHTVNVNPQLLSAPSATPSLHELFQDFIQDNILRRQSNLSPQQLRLILHPLQSLICHLRQMSSCFSDVFSSPSPGSGSVTKASILQRLEETQILLKKWYDLSTSYSKSHPNCPVTRSNLVLYHLVALNTVTDFPEIERLARREGSSPGSGSAAGGLNPNWELPALRHGRCISHRQKAIFHCGQVFRLLRLMPTDRRPAWWSAAVYRATLILWADSVCRIMDPNFPIDNHCHSSPIAPQSPGPVAVMIDQLIPEEPALMTFTWGGGGVPCLTTPEGATVGLDKPAEVLSYGVKTIETCFSSRIGDGIKRKMIQLGNNWSADLMGLSRPGSSSC